MLALSEYEQGGVILRPAGRRRGQEGLHVPERHPPGRGSLRNDTEFRRARPNHGKREGGGFKPAHLRSLLGNVTSNGEEEDYYGWVLYMDSDAMIVNFDYSASAPSLPASMTRMR